MRFETHTTTTATADWKSRAYHQTARQQSVSLFAVYAKSKAKWIFANMRIRDYYSQYMDIYPTDMGMLIIDIKLERYEFNIGC